MTLSGTNTYAGTTILNRSLTVSSDANLGTGNIIFNSGSSNLFITGNTVIDNNIQAGGAIAAFNVGSNTVEITGNISGSNGLSSGGSGGTLKLSGTNTYNGSTYGSLNNTIIATTDAALPDATQLELGAGTLELLSHQTIGSLNTYTNLVPHGPSSVINLGTYHLTLGANDASKFSGAINGSGNIIKNGNGTFTVSSSTATANNGNHSGTTIINGGVLQLDGTLKGGITIASGGKLAGGGTTTLEGDALGAVSVASGGTLTPGASAGVGTADLKTGALTVASGGTLEMYINGTSAGATSQGYDQVIVTGAVDVSGATLTVTGNSSNFTVGDIFVLVDNDAGDAVTGTFNGLTEGATVTVNGTPMKLSYVGGTGNDITLTAQMGITGIALSADTGSSSTDFITNTASQTITATLNSALGSSGITIWGSVDNGGNWTDVTGMVSGTTLTWTGATLSGTSTLKIEARNSSSAVVGSAEQAYVLDATAPTTTIASLAFSADTGTAGDFITKTASQTISGTLNVVSVAGEKVQVSLDNGINWADADNTVGQNTWSLAGQTLTGSNTLQVRVMDAAGNSGTAATQAYVLDSTAPTITFSGLGLSADTGSSSSDFKTATAGQTISATLSGAPAGTDKVWGSIDNGSNWIDITNKVTGTTLSWDSVTLVGSNIIRLKVTDNAGNDGVNAIQTFTLDTTNPTATVTTANVGIGSNVTTAQSTETGTLYLVKSTDTPADLAALEALVTGGTATKATVTAINTNTPLATTGLTAGTYKIYSVDAAGNVSAVSTNTITLGTAPTTTVATVVFSADSGTSSSDFITKTAAQDVSGTLSAVTVAGETVEVSLDNGVNWLPATNVIGQSTWTLTGQTLAGSNTLLARVTSAGFSSTAFSQAYTLDTTAPTASVSTATMGTGSSVTTSQSTETGVVYLVKTGTAVSDLASLETAVSGANATKANVTATGTNTTIATTGLAAGEYKIYSVDAAGNVSAASANTITLATPPTTTNLSATFSADTGVSSTDFITSTAAQDLSGTLSAVTVAGEIVQVSLDNGATWTTATNTIGETGWTLAGQTLTGSNTLQVRVSKDGVAGTASSQAYVLDTTAPTFNPAGSTPADNATSATISADVIAVFNEVLASNSDLTKIYLKDVATDTLVPATFSLNGSGQLVINPNASLAYSTAYYVTWDADALKDAAGNAIAALADETTFNFTTAAAPPPPDTGGGTGGTTTGGGTTGGGATGGGDTGGGDTGSGDTGSGGTGSGDTGGGNTGGTGIEPGIPTGTFDGVTITGTTQTTTTGTTVTTITVPVVTDTREDDPDTLLNTHADIPLAVDNAGAPVIQVSVPTGVGMTSQTISGTAGNTQLTLREILIAASNPKVEDSTTFETILQQGIDAFVPGVQDEAQVTVRTVTLTVPTGTTQASNAPIIVTGATGTGESDVQNPNRQEALVIDVRNLPSGTVLQLDNVEFAIIVGATRVIGGNGRNFAVGDDARQFMVLGEEDDVLRGGGGDDTVASKGGADKLYGDDGNDTLVGGVGNDLLEGGAGNDILQGGASDAGTWEVVRNAQGQTYLRFTATEAALTETVSHFAESAYAHDPGSVPLADGRAAFLHTDMAKAETIALLYQAVLGRLPSNAEINYWAAQDLDTGRMGQLAYEAYAAQTSATTRGSIESQVKQLIEQVWDSASTEMVQIGTRYIEAGGSWADGLLWLAQHENLKAKLMDSNGLLSIMQPLTLGETGWSANAGNDQLFGGAGKDLLVGGNGNNILDGGAGIDLVVMPGNVAHDYQLGLQEDPAGQIDLVIRTVFSGDMDILRNVEYAKIGGVFYGPKSSGAPALEVGEFQSLASFVEVIGVAQMQALGVPESWF